MKIYVSRRDENVTAKLDETYSNEQTVILEYLTGDKIGKTTSITHSTLKRWWKAVEVENTVEDIDETDANLELLAGGDSKEQAETPVDIMTITRPVVEVVNKPINNKPVKSNIFDYVISLLTVDYKLSTNGKKITLLCNNKPFATIYKRKNSIRLYCAKEVIETLGQLVYNIDKGEKLNQLSAYVDYTNINAVLSKIS